MYGTKSQDSFAGGASTSRPGFGRPQAPAKGKQKETLKDGETLVRLAENVQSRLNEAVESNDGLKKFMNHCAYVWILACCSSFSLGFPGQMNSMRNT